MQATLTSAPPLRIRAARPEDRDTLCDLATQRLLRRIDAAGLPGPHSARVRESTDITSIDQGLVGRDGVVALRGRDAVTQAVMWQDGTHPITNDRARLFFHLLESRDRDDPAAPRDAHALRTLLGVACGNLPADIDELQADIAAHERAGELGEILTEAGFRDHNLFVRKLVAAPDADAAPQLPPGAVFRPLNPHNEDEFEFAVDCLRYSILQGMETAPETAPEPEYDRVTRYVESWLRTVDGDALRSFIIEYEGAPVAHALVSLTPAWQSAEREAMIVDIVVPDTGQRNHGWSRLITSQIEQVVARDGIRSLAATVGALGGRRPQALLDNLSRAGWWIDSVSMLKRRR